MKIRLIRHATLWVELAGLRLLVDPMFAAPGAYRSLTAGKSAGRNPLAPLPSEVEAWLHPDAVLVTHAHFDHFDSEAARQLPKGVPILCPPVDQGRYRKLGFEQVVAVDQSPLAWNKLQISRVGGRHGSGLIGRAMGPVSGFIIQAEQAPRLYIAGDTVWHPAVSAALAEHQPGVIVVNAGAAQFNLGAPITMTAQDVVEVCRAAHRAKVVAVHMEAINHCRLTRRELAKNLSHAGVAPQVAIPADGESVEYG
jgi:L-ascorbate metabolism protein UlaG (beta-lactamase superfamily)